MNFSEKEIRKHLIGQFKNCPIKIFPSLDSTNTEAKRGNYPVNCVLIALKQTGGRGRLGKTFYSPEGTGLYISIITAPWDKDTEKMTVAAGRAVMDAVFKATGIKTEKRRINDIYLQEKKICGILAEGIVNPDTSKIEKVVIGIGLNIVEPVGGFPREIADVAGALYPDGQDAAYPNRQAADPNRIAAEITNNVFIIM